MRRCGGGRANTAWDPAVRDRSFKTAAGDAPAVKTRKVEVATHSRAIVVVAMQDVQGVSIRAMKRRRWSEGELRNHVHG
jgi:hypothetical protein